MGSETRASCNACVQAACETREGVVHRRKGNRVGGRNWDELELHEVLSEVSKIEGQRGAESPPSDSHVLLQGSHIDRAPLI